MDSGCEEWSCAPGGTGEIDKNKRVLSFCRLTDRWGGVLGNRIVPHWDKRQSRGGHKSSGGREEHGQSEKVSWRA